MKKTFALMLLVFGWLLSLGVVSVFLEAVHVRGPESDSKLLESYTTFALFF